MCDLPPNVAKVDFLFWALWATAFLFAGHLISEGAFDLQADMRRPASSRPARDGEASASARPECDPPQADQQRGGLNP